MEWKFSKCLSVRMAGFLNILEVLLSTENLIAKRPLKILTTRQKILVMQVSKFSDCGLEFAGIFSNRQVRGRPLSIIRF